MKNKTNSRVDAYLIEGCGRCPLGGTPNCKAPKWQAEMKWLRRIVLDCGLTEEVKWSVPCYTTQKRNVVLLSAFKEYCALNFVKGALLKAPRGVLQKPGESTQAGRQIRFTSLQEVIELETVVTACLQQAIEVERAGRKVRKKKHLEPMPEELQDKLDAMPELKAAFEALTPGRQRCYILHIYAAKQSKTRTSRVEKHVQRILSGRGLHD